MENVVTVEEARTIRLKEKNKISKLILKWTRDARTRMCESLSHKITRMSLGYKVTTVYPFQPGWWTLLLITWWNEWHYQDWWEFSVVKQKHLSNSKSFPIKHGKPWRVADEDPVERAEVRACSCSLYCPYCGYTSLPQVEHQTESSDNVISSMPVGACASSSKYVSEETIVVKSCKLPLHQWRVLHQWRMPHQLVSHKLFNHRVMQWRHARNTELDGPAHKALLFNCR